MHDIRPLIPELFESPGTLLYVGARADAHSWLEELLAVGHQTVILEVWPENVEGLQSLFADKAWIVQGDVREDAVYPAGIKSFDYVFWWHGPEHLSHDEVIPTIKNLESKTKKLIALAAPYGIYPQGAHKGNPHEEHKTTIYPYLFRSLSYNVVTDGEVDQPGSEVVGWKVISK